MRASSNCSSGVANWLKRRANESDQVLKSRRSSRGTPNWSAITYTGKGVVNRLLDLAGGDMIARRLAAKQRDVGLYAVMRAEQAPNPASRVKLTDEVDAFGVRRAALDWRFSEIDGASVGGLMSLLDGELQRMGLGHVDPAPWIRDPSADWKIDPLISSHHIGGYHHIGTTRMASSATTGVCDADCRVFGSENLFIAGSSLFPTSGWANPTTSIMALAMRLGDHIAEKRV